MKDNYNLQNESVVVELIKKGKIITTINIDENHYDFNSLNSLLNGKLHKIISEDRNNAR